MIINLTQHTATPEQVAAGVIDPPADAREAIRDLLTFHSTPSAVEISARAHDLAEIAAMTDLSITDASEFYARAAMIGGASWLMSALERELIQRCLQPLYAFSVRESKEEQQPDGSVKKVNVFKHAGFVEV